MLSWIKHIIKKYFQILWTRHKFSPAVQIAQRQLINFYQTLPAHTQTNKFLPIKETGYSVFSQFEEDGKLIYILSKIGVKHELFIDIGSDDGINSNCANLALNLQWRGLFIDANPRSIARGEYFYKRYPNPYGNKPTFRCSKVSRENINDIISSAGYSGAVDLLSIDIDGNDYWIWDAISVVTPRIVIVETHINFGERDIVVPYDPNYIFPGKHPDYHGASAEAMIKLGRKKGYRLIGANNLGFNFIFLKNEEGIGEFPEVAFKEIMSHPAFSFGDLDPKVLEMPFETPIR